MHPMVERSQPEGVDRGLDIALSPGDFSVWGALRARVARAKRGDLRAGQVNVLNLS